MNESEQIQSDPCVLCGATAIAERWVEDGVEMGRIVKPCNCGVTRHRFTTAAYAHAHDLGMVPCAVCGQRWSAPVHDVPAGAS